MTITTTQKVIKIGDSAGVTIPAKELKRAGIKPGDSVELTFHLVNKPDDHATEVVALTQQLIARHQKALDSLSQR
jgi:antitoxin component of MazEF toxin-antitoxin module